MKYILIIVICFMGLATKAQVQKQGRSNFPTVVDSSLAIGKNFILPVFRSFSQLATYTNLDSSGRLVFIRDSNAVFYRDNAHQWVKFNSGSSGSAVWGSITGTLSNQTDLQAVLDSKVDSVILRGGDSLYNHYATGEVQFIGLLSGGSVSDTLIVTFPLYVNETNDTLSIPQASTDSSGYLSASDWNYFAVKPDSTVLNATGDTLLSYLGSTVIYSKAIAGGSSGWSLTGNVGTDSTTNFIGTADNKPVIIKVNGFQVGRFGINEQNVAFGAGAIASGPSSFAAVAGQATGNTSVALGNSYASGFNSFSSGGASIASGDYSTATGDGTIASGNSSHSSGSNTIANGDYSMALNRTTIANHKNSLVVGIANDTTGQVINDTSVLFQIGNGYINDDETIVNRSNILTATYTGVGIGTTTPIAKLHIASTDTFALVVTGMGNSVVGTDSAVVRDIDGNFKVAAKSSGGGVSTAQLTDSLNARGATYLQVNNPSATGSFTLTSTTGGIVNARMTSAQMNAISSPTSGTQIYNTDFRVPMYYDSAWGWVSDNSDWKKRNMIDYTNDFLGILNVATGALSDGNLLTYQSSGAVISSSSSTGNHQGLVNLSTSTSATGRAGIGTSVGASNLTMILGGGRIVWETDVNFATLSAPTERYQALFGFSSTNNSTAIANGVLFLYDSAGVATGSTASPNWQVFTAASNTRSFTTTSVAVSAATWYKLTAVINAAGNSVEFYINDVLVKTETNNVPTAALGMMNQIYKTVGTTARTVDVDYIYFKQKFTTAR